MKKVGRRLLLAIAIIIGAVSMIQLPFFIAEILYLNTYLYEERKTEEVNIEIFDNWENETDVYNSLIKKCNGYINGKPLTQVVTVINEGKIEIKFYFVKYINDFAEGGRVECTEILVDFDNRIVKSIEYFNGDNKGHGVPVKPITFLDSLSYSNAIDNYYKSDEYSKSDDRIVDDSNALVRYTEDFISVESVGYKDLYYM